MKPRTGIIAGGCGMLLALCFGGVFLVAMFGPDSGPAPRSAEPQRPAASSPAPDPARIREDLAQEAYYFGREACRQALKAPTTAKFTSPFSDPHTGWTGYGYMQWEVFGQVDAQNSFGALIREDWYAIVHLVAGQWEVQYLRLGSTEAGNLPRRYVAPR